MNREKEIQDLQECIEWCYVIIRKNKERIEYLKNNKCYCKECIDKEVELEDLKRQIEEEFKNVGMLECRVDIYEQEMALAKVKTSKEV